MMTRDKKRRTATKDTSSPRKSNQKYSTLPANDAVEVGEVVTMDQGGTSGSLHDYRQPSDYRQVAWLLREKLNELVDGDQGEFPEAELRSLLDMAAARNVISVDPKVLNPVIWRILPKDLLVLILAQLPLPDITRLRSLSTEWRRELATANSDINQACDEASSNMVALLSHSSTDTCFVSIYDITKSRWEYAYHLRLRRPVSWNDDLEPCPDTWTPVDACDGGLMCFISLWKPTKRNRFSIVVVNLLTRVQHELPPTYYKYFTLPAMVQIKVDSHTKCYKVVVATYRAGRAGRLTIETYDSGTSEWTLAVPPSGSIVGRVHIWTSANAGCYKLSSSIPGACDFGKRKLLLFMHCTLFESDTALGTDRVFELHEQTRMNTSMIGEFHFDNQAKAWVEEKSYICPAFEDGEVEELHSVRLNACDGFLMVIFHCDQKGTYFRLLDTSTGEWKNVPKNPDFEGLHTPASVLCRAVWNVVP